MCVVCLMAPGCLATLGHCDSTIINETFAGTTATGWQFKGAVGTAHTDDGTPLASTYYLGTAGSPHGYLELTQSGVGWQRASAFYTAQTVATTNFDIKAQVNITGGADGLTFCFVDANSVSHDVSKLFGGYGQWEGAPRGCLPNIPSTNARGYYAGLKGFNFEFDHFKNGNEKSAEYLSMVSLSQLSADNQDWLHYSTGTKDFSTDSLFYTDRGWMPVEFTGRLDSNGTEWITYGWGTTTASPGKAPGTPTRSHWPTGPATRTTAPPPTSASPPPRAARPRTNGFAMSSSTRPAEAGRRSPQPGYSCCRPCQRQGWCGGGGEGRQSPPLTGRYWLNQREWSPQPWPALRGHG